MLYISSGKRPIQKLSRTEHTAWTIAAAAIKNGPFLDENTNESVFLYTTNAAVLDKGVIFKLQAFGGDVWQPDHVGALWLIRVRSGGKHYSWGAGYHYSVGNIVVYNNNYYICVKGGAAGANPPLHTDGIRADGSTDECKWKYLHSGFGVVKITAYTSARQVTAEVQSYVPDELYVSADDVPDEESAWPDESTGVYGTNNWAEGAWSAVRGYPKILLRHQGRLCAFSSDNLGSTWWASAFEDYENFLAGSKDTDAFIRTLGADDEVTEILWATTGKRMTIGTSGTEFIVQASANRQLLTPDNAYADPATGEGSAPIKPVRIDQPVFVSKDRRRVMTIGLAPNGEDYEPEDLTMFASHVSETGIMGVAWQREPYRILWAWRSDGMLIGFTYRKDQGVQGWHRHPASIGGVKAAVSVPSSTGTRQDLWLITERTLPSGTKRYIECLMPFFETLPATDKKAVNGWFVDCGTLVSGEALQEITAGSDFEGAALWVLADGKFSKQTVQGGKFTLANPASTVLWGLPFAAKLKTLPYDRNTDGGANSGRKQRVSKITAKLLNSCVLTASAGKDEEAQEMLPTGGQAMGVAPSLYSGTLSSTAPGDWDAGGQVEVISAGPFPMTVLSITPTIQTVTG